MIVNTAYIYMGGGAAVNPNLWQDGVSNYPVEFTDSSISSEGLLLSGRGNATFSELPLAGFNSLILYGSSNVFNGSTSCTIEFFNSTGQSLGTEMVKFSKSVESKTVNIPSAAKIENAKIKMTNNARANTITISQALLS